MTKKIGSRWKRMAAIALAVVMVLGVSNIEGFTGGTQGSRVYGADSWLPVIQSSGDESVTQGSRATVVFNIKNIYTPVRN
ncbi:MAG: hypothetical protein RRY25_01970, partial [Anaerovorax sp.]